MAKKPKPFIHASFWRWLLIASVLALTGWGLYRQFPGACISVIDKLLNIPFSQMVLFLGTIMIIRLLYIAHNDPRIDFVDIITGLDGKASGPKIQNLVAFVIASWVVVESRLVGDITTGLILLLILYAAIYTANPIAAGIFSTWAKLKLPDIPVVPQSVETTTTTTIPGGQIEVKTKPADPPPAAP